jgi:peptide deformylase
VWSEQGLSGFDVSGAETPNTARRFGRDPVPGKLRLGAVAQHDDTSEHRVVQVGTPGLRQRAIEVPTTEITSNDIKELIARLWGTLEVVPGVGLAAPQIGDSRRVVVVQDPPEFVERLTPSQQAERERVPIEPYVLINPELTVIGSETRTFYEGCLSVTGYVAAVERFHEVDVRFVTVTGQAKRQRVRGWHARILQHEVDHLNGTLYVDRMDTRTLCAEALSASFGPATAGEDADV